MIKNVTMTLVVLLLIGIGVFVFNYEEIMHWYTFNSIPATPVEKVDWFADFANLLTGTETVSAEDYQK